MRPTDIDKFFTRLAKKFPHPARVILTGGGAAILEGVSRATRDLDFQLQLPPSGKGSDAFQAALQRVEEETQIVAEFADSIESWSSISWPSPRPKAKRYKRFGRIDVHLLDPLWWSVGKVARFLAYDISDVVTVFRNTKVRPRDAAIAWGKALGRSPLSNAQPLFRQHVLAFFERHGAEVWGKSFQSDAYKELFSQNARKAHKTR